MNPVIRASKVLGSQSRLAAALGVTPMSVSHWKNRGVPAAYCLTIQELTDGEVTVFELRPDIFGSQVSPPK